MMRDTLLSFGSQFAFKAEVINSEKLKHTNKFVVTGMGGSHLSAGLYRTYNPHCDLYIHRDYGLPTFSPSFLRESLIIASSYSGNTEEIIDGVTAALDRGLSLAVVSVGGKLLELAKAHNLPYIQLPDTGIQPRSALGFSTIALAKLIGDEEALEELASLATSLGHVVYESQGRALAQSMQGKVPVIYSSAANLSLAYNWKIKFNETGKIPAFSNVFSELNHNEMTGFDVIPATKMLSDRFHFIFLEDQNDNPKVQKRMAITKKLYEDRGLPVTAVSLSGSNAWEKIFTNLLLADWTALATAELYGTESEQVPMVEEFKKLIV